MAIDIINLPGPPAGQPLAPTDLTFIARPPGPNQSAQSASVGMSVTLQDLAAVLMAFSVPTVMAIAQGVDQQTASALAASSSNIITAGNPGSGVRLPSGPGQALPILNSLTVPVLLFPPLTPNASGTGNAATSINNQAAGTPVTIPPGVEAMARSIDGFNWFVG